MAAGPIYDDMKWRSNSGDYITTEYEDTYLVFVKASGETHFLNFLSFGVVSEVGETSKTVAELTIDLRARFDLKSDELNSQLVSKTVAELDDTGLIWPDRAS